MLPEQSSRGQMVRVVACGLAALFLIAGCKGQRPGDQGRTISARDFAHASDVPLQVVGGAPIEGALPDDSLPVTAADPPAESISLRPGQRWTVDALIGQVNGRPIYASQFFSTIEDRIRRVVAEQPPAAARQQVQRIIEERFQQYIDNELVIAEAESLLTAEQQQGLLGFLRNLQEETIAGHGGNRASATASLDDQFGMSIDQYMRQKRDELLAQDLLRRRVNPRVIVSWRDVERAYLRNIEAFNPSARISIGRIRASNTDPVRVEQIKQLIAQGRTLPQIAETIGQTDKGLLGEFELTAGGVEALDLVDSVKAALRGLEVGQVTAPLAQGTSTVWYAVLAIDRPKGRTLFDPLVQLQIRGQLQEIRRRSTQYRYLASLRDRWISEDVDQMQRRLVQIGFQRYIAQ